MRRVDQRSVVLAEKLGMTCDELDDERAAILRMFQERFRARGLEERLIPTTYAALIQLCREAGVTQQQIEGD